MDSTQQVPPIWKRLLPWRILRVGFGLFLLVSAFLKFQNLGAGNSLVSELMPQLEWLIIQFEILLGLWLISGWWSSYSRIVLLILLSAFTGANLVMVLQGKSSCGCLGAASVHPIWMLMFDWFGVLMVALSNPSVSNVSGSESAVARGFQSRRGMRRPVLVTAIAVASLAGAMFIAFSPAIAEKLASFSVHGQTLVFEPAVSDAGKGAPGEWKTVTLRLRNDGDEPVRLLGGKESCSCRTLDSLPLTIAPGGCAVFDVSVRLGATSGVQTGHFWLLTDSQTQGAVICRWRAVVDSNQNENISERSGD